MATSRLRGKGVTSIASLAIGMDELLVFTIRERDVVRGGRKFSDVFFPAKTLRNAPWEVGDLSLYEFPNTTRGGS